MNDPKVIYVDPLELMLACVVCFSFTWLIFSRVKSLTVRRWLCLPLYLVAKYLIVRMVDSSDGLIQVTGWVCLAFLVVVVLKWVMIPMIQIDNERRRAVGLKWYQRDRDHKVDAYIKTGRIPQSNAPAISLKSQEQSNAPDVGITRYYSPDVRYDDTLFGLHMLGGVRLVWDAYPVGDGPLEIGNLHLEDATGKPVRFGWAARRCEDDAYELANRYSDVPGHYVLDLPGGTVAAPTATSAPDPQPTAPDVPQGGSPTHNGVTVTASNLHYDDGGDCAPPSGQQYLIAHVVLTNNGDQPANYNELDFKIEGSNDYQRYDAGAFDLNVSNTALNSGTLDPGQTVAGDLAFEVPSGQQLWTLLWTPDIFGDSIAVPFSN